VKLVQRKTREIVWRSSERFEQEGVIPKIFLKFLFMSTEAEKGKKSGIASKIKEALQPGVTPWLITVARISIAILLCYCCIMDYIDGNIHYYILTVISVCLFLSFEYSVIYMKKCPEFLHTPKKD
jgi:hypothetical protein